MGFLGLIPADQLSAKYDSHFHILVLSAKGKVQDSTTGITFDRLPWPGGLKFQLEGWTGPLMDSHSPYSHTQEFSIQLPSPATPSNDVIIVDANHPKGQVIHISGLPAGDQTTSAQGTTKQPQASSAIGQQPQVLTANGEKLNVLFKEPFQIKDQAGSLGPYGTIGIKFDANFLTLQGAGMQGDNIAWTFNSLQTGNTQIVVTTISGGITAVAMSKTYDVKIFVLE